MTPTPEERPSRHRSRSGSGSNNKLRTNLEELARLDAQLKALRIADEKLNAKDAKVERQKGDMC